VLLLADGRLGGAALSMRGLDVVLGALVVSTIGLAVAFPLVYLNTCGPNKSQFYGDAPADLKKLVRDDDDISKPNGCNVCPDADQVPVWIAPGDVCKLPGYGPDVFEHCDLNDEFDYENDYAVEHHFKDCLAKEQLDHLWTTGHCHSNVTGLPYLAEDGMLFCYLAFLNSNGDRNGPIQKMTHVQNQTTIELRPVL
jgi:hypothetical protein